MLYAIIAVEIAAIVAAGLVVRFMTKDTENRPRTILLSAAFFLVAFVALGIGTLGTINYKIPVLWIAATVVAFLLLAVLAFLVGRSVGWKLQRLVGLVGLLAIAFAAFGMLMYSEAGANVARGLYRARTAQIAESFGFTALMPADEELPTDMLPVSELPGDDEGITLQYSGFELQERKAPGDVTADDLLEIVGPGTEPLGEQRVVIPADAETTELTVGGEPAVGVEFYSQKPGASEDSAKTEKTTILVTVIDGVEVRFWSAGREELLDGEWELLPAYSPHELAEFAETLEPVE